jgi:L-lactate permease
VPPAWPQNYDPTGAWPLSTLLAALPVVILFAVLVGLRRAVWQAALAGLVAALALAWLAFGMPAPLVSAAAAHGVVFGLFRIAAGMDTVLGLSLTRTGVLYPFFGTLLGWLGVALTGTDAGSNALFGNLQKVTAEQLGLSPVLMASANSAGGVMGKMIDAQSIVVATTATRQLGQEAAVFRAVFKHSLVLAALVALVTSLYAFALPGLIPPPGR